MKRVIAASAFALLAGFHQPASFDASAGDGGGNRVYFDGSPRQKSYDCSACHTEPAKLISARIDGMPDAYTAGTTYAISVALIGEHAGFGTANNQNGFVAEIVDDGGMSAGTLATLDVDKVKTIDDGLVISGEGKDLTMWSFNWTAPSAGRGALTLHLGLVDGDGAQSASVPQNDPGGDDVAVAKVRACEGAPGCADLPKPALTDSKVAGCSAGGGGGVGGSGSLVALALFGLRRRRAAVLAVALAGCFAPTTPAECPDHVCGGTNPGVVDAASSCKENWVCSAWEAPAGSDQATRSCTDKNSAGSTDCKPPTSATLPALDLDYYKCQVQPIFQRGCGQMACHGPIPSTRSASTAAGACATTRWSRR